MDNYNFLYILQNYNYPFTKYYANIINSTRDSKTNIIVYGDEYVLLDHRDVPNRTMVGESPVIKPNNIKYGDFYKKDDDNIWLAVRSNDVQYAFNNTVDTDIKEIRNTKILGEEIANQAIKYGSKILENDKRMSKYHYEDMIDTDDNRKIVFNSNSAIHKFLTNNIPMKVNEVQKSYVVDSIVKQIE